MKNIFIKLSLLFFATLVLISCNDDFLERFPLDETPKEYFWKTENDLKVYNNNLYFEGLNKGNLPILYGHESGTSEGTYYNLDFMSDNTVMAQASFGSNFEDIRSGTHAVKSAPRFLGYKGWGFLRAVNIGIDNYGKVPIPPATLNMYVGEGRLFRGLFYAYIVSRFNDVQWVDHELTDKSPELFAPRISREEAMEHVLADINFACENLPTQWAGGDSPGRLNKWAALALKSRICLFEGTWRKYHGGTNPTMWLQEAADAAKEVMDNGGYLLHTSTNPLRSYNETHRDADQDLKGNKEVIYWQKFESGVWMNNALAGFIALAGGATKSLVEDYLCTDGLPISLSSLYQGDAQFEDIFVNRDPRLRQTILHPDDALAYEYRKSAAVPNVPWLPGMAGGPEPSVSGYHVIKMFVRSQAHTTANTKTSPAVLVRLGEVMLNYAEAKAELGNISQSDLDVSINKLRDRVGMVHMDINNVPVDPRYINDGVSPLIVEIRRERRIELAVEGFRYNDLIRWKQGKKLEAHSYGILWDAAAIARYPKAKVPSSVDPVSGKTYLDPYKGTVYANPVFDETKHYLWPLPLDVLSQNPSLEQNPKW